tara:strand:+ start:715 stop:981 length:267 start_codon:yes stop_codon:yes gene_type:complete
MLGDDLGNLKSKIESIEKKKLKNKQIEHNSLSIGLKMSLEIISPIIAGVLIGLGFDKIFSTKPIFFLFFLLLGIIAGFFNIYKTVNKL